MTIGRGGAETPEMKGNKATTPAPILNVHGAQSLKGYVNNDRSELRGLF